jgi:hypothetical protein
MSMQLLNTSTSARLNITGNTMKLITLLLFLSLLLSCSNHKQDGKPISDKVFFRDSTYKFPDPEYEKIMLAKYDLKDSNNKRQDIRYGDFKYYYLDFKYYRKENDKWSLKSSYDSIIASYKYSTNHNDYNGDKIKDFVFISHLGTGSEDVYYNLLLFDNAAKRFRLIKGFDIINSPGSIDTVKNRVPGWDRRPSDSRVRTKYYTMFNDSILQ